MEKRATQPSRGFRVARLTQRERKPTLLDCNKARGGESLHHSLSPWHDQLGETILPEGVPEKMGEQLVPNQETHARMKGVPNQRLQATRLPGRQAQA